MHKFTLATVATCGFLFMLTTAVFSLSQQDRAATLCMSNLRNLGSAFHLYTGDYDEVCPLAFNDSGVGTWDWQRWNRTPGLIQDSGNSHWASAVYPYIVSSGPYRCPDAELHELVGSKGNSRVRVTYTYNGLLHGFAASSIVSPATLPMLWEGFGKVAVVGHSASNPTLMCGRVTSPCIYGKAAGIMFKPLATMFVHDAGSYIAYADTHVKWVPLGREIPREDPFARYEDGIPAEYWGAGDYPVMFRPDSTADDVQGAERRPLFEGPRL